MKNKLNTFDKGFYGNFTISKFKAAIAFWSLFTLFFASAEAQNYPREIRGYKVYKTKISIKNDGEKNDSKDDSEAFVTLGEPKLASLFLSGITLEITIKMRATDQSGKIDFLTFKDFKVNGLDVDLEEYNHSFSFEKNKPLDLPNPVKVFLGTGQTLMGGLGEMRDSKEEWNVTGTVFVFGKFKKMGFNFKRVIPVEVSVKIKNPVKKQSREILPF